MSRRKTRVFGVVCKLAVKNAGRIVGEQATEMRHFARRMLLGAAFAFAGVVACAAEIAPPDTTTEAGAPELVASDEVLPPEREAFPAPALAAPALQQYVGPAPASARLKTPLDRSPNALLRELYLADKEAGLDAFLAEMRGQALSPLSPSTSPAEARGDCVGGRGCPSRVAAERPQRSAEDRELLASLAEFRADVRDLVSPLATIYQDSGLRALLETPRSDDLIFGRGRSSADAMQDRSAVIDSFAENRGAAGGRRESSDEVLALVRFIGDFWQIMRDFGIPLLLILIMIRGAIWIAKARRA